MCRRLAVLEPAGVRCLLVGHWTPLLKTLPLDHCSGLGGRDWRNRARQSAIDASYRHPGRAREIVADLLERLEGKPKAVPA